MPYDGVYKMVAATAVDGNLRVLAAERSDEDDPREWLYALELAAPLIPRDARDN